MFVKGKWFDRANCKGKILSVRRDRSVAWRVFSIVVMAAELRIGKKRRGVRMEARWCDDLMVASINWTTFRLL